MSLNQIIGDASTQAESWKNIHINNLVCDGVIQCAGFTGATGTFATPTSRGVVFGQTSNTSTNESLGYNALVAVSTGTANTAIGRNAAQTITTGLNNTHVGYNAQNSNAASSNNTIVGSNSTASGSSNVCVGNSITNTATSGTAVGSGSSVLGDGGIAIGHSAIVNAGHTGSVAVGESASSTAANQLLVVNTITDLELPGVVTMKVPNLQLSAAAGAPATVSALPANTAYVLINTLTGQLYVKNG